MYEWMSMQCAIEVRNEWTIDLWMKWLSIQCTIDVWTYAYECTIDMWNRHFTATVSQSTMWELLPYDD